MKPKEKILTWLILSCVAINCTNSEYFTSYQITYGSNLSEDTGEPSGIYMSENTDYTESTLKPGRSLSLITEAQNDQSKEPVNSKKIQTSRITVPQTSSRELSNRRKIEAIRTKEMYLEIPPLNTRKMRLISTPRLEKNREKIQRELMNNKQQSMKMSSNYVFETQRIQNNRQRQISRIHFNLRSRIFKQNYPENYKLKNTNKNMESPKAGLETKQRFFSVNDMRTVEPLQRNTYKQNDRHTRQERLAQDISRQNRMLKSYNNRKEGIRFGSQDYAARTSLNREVKSWGNLTPESLRKASISRQRIPEKETELYTLEVKHLSNSEERDSYRRQRDIRTRQNTRVNELREASKSRQNILTRKSELSVQSRYQHNTEIDRVRHIYQDRSTEKVAASRIIDRSRRIVQGSEERTFGNRIKLQKMNTDIRKTRTYKPKMGHTRSLKLFRSAESLDKLRNIRNAKSSNEKIKLNDENRNAPVDYFSIESGIQKSYVNKNTERIKNKIPLKKRNIDFHFSRNLSKQSLITTRTSVNRNNEQSQRIFNVNRIRSLKRTDPRLNILNAENSLKNTRRLKDVPKVMYNKVRKEMQISDKENSGVTRSENAVTRRERIFTRRIRGEFKEKLVNNRQRILQGRTRRFGKQNDSERTIVENTRFLSITFPSYGTRERYIQDENILLNNLRLSNERYRKIQDEKNRLVAKHTFERRIETETQQRQIILKIQQLDYRSPTLESPSYQIKQISLMNKYRIRKQWNDLKRLSASNRGMKETQYINTNRIRKSVLGSRSIKHRLLHQRKRMTETENERRIDTLKAFQRQTINLRVKSRETAEKHEYTNSERKVVADYRTVESIEEHFSKNIELLNDGKTQSSRNSNRNIVRRSGLESHEEINQMKIVTRSVYNSDFRRKIEHGRRLAVNKRRFSDRKVRSVSLRVNSILGVRSTEKSAGEISLTRNGKGLRREKELRMTNDERYISSDKFKKNFETMKYKFTIPVRKEKKKALLVRQLGYTARFRIRTEKSGTKSEKNYLSGRVEEKLVQSIRKTHVMRKDTRRTVKGRGFRGKVDDQLTESDDSLTRLLKSRFVSRSLNKNYINGSNKPDPRIKLGNIYKIPMTRRNGRGFRGRFSRLIAALRMSHHHAELKAKNPSHSFANIRDLSKAKNTLRVSQFPELTETNQQVREQRNAENSVRMNSIASYSKQRKGTFTIENRLLRINRRSTHMFSRESRVQSVTASIQGACKSPTPIKELKMSSHNNIPVARKTSIRDQSHRFRLSLNSIRNKLSTRKGHDRLNNRKILSNSRGSMERSVETIYSQSLPLSLLRNSHRNLVSRSLCEGVRCSNPRRETSVRGINNRRKMLERENMHYNSKLSSYDRVQENKMNSALEHVSILAESQVLQKRGKYEDQNNEESRPLPQEPWIIRGKSMLSLIMNLVLGLSIILAASEGNSIKSRPFKERLGDALFLRSNVF